MKTKRHMSWAIAAPCPAMSIRLIVVLLSYGGRSHREGVDRRLIDEPHEVGCYPYVRRDGVHLVCMNHRQTSVNQTAREGRLSCVFLSHKTDQKPLLLSFNDSSHGRQDNTTIHVFVGTTDDRSPCGLVDTSSTWNILGMNHQATDKLNAGNIIHDDSSTLKPLRSPVPELIQVRSARNFARLTPLPGSSQCAPLAPILEPPSTASTPRSSSVRTPPGPFLLPWV